MEYLLKKIIDFIIWLVWFPLRGLIIQIPFSITNTLLKGGSYLFYLIDKRRREGVAEEVSKSFGERFNDKEIEKIVKLSFYTLTKRSYEHLLFGRITEDDFDKVASIEGISYLEESLKKNKGVILLTFHFGSLFLLFLWVGLKGYKLHIMPGTPLFGGSGYIWHIKNRLYELRRKEEQGYPYKVISTKDYPKCMVEVLEKNESVLMTIDGREARKFLPLKFLKRTAQFSPAIISLAMRTGAVILPFVVIRGKDKKDKIIIEPTMELTFVEDREEMLRVNLEKLIKILERYVWKYPDHYAMSIYSMREEAKLGLLPALFID